MCAAPDVITELLDLAAAIAGIDMVSLRVPVDQDIQVAGRYSSHFEQPDNPVELLRARVVMAAQVRYRDGLAIFERY